MNVSQLESTVKAPLPKFCAPWHNLCQSVAMSLPLQGGVTEKNSLTVTQVSGTHVNNFLSQFGSIPPVYCFLNSSFQLDKGILILRFSFQLFPPHSSRHLHAPPDPTAPQSHHSWWAYGRVFISHDSVWLSANSKGRKANPIARARTAWSPQR